MSWQLPTSEPARGKTTPKWEIGRDGDQDPAGEAAREKGYKPNLFRHFPMKYQGKLLPYLWHVRRHLIIWKGSRLRTFSLAPPSPKPSAHCDGITAFEKPSTSNKLTRAPPPLRLKPTGGVSWKPKPPSPPVDSPAFAGGAAASNEGEAGAVKSGMGGQMSVSDVRRVLDAGVLAR
ncbi:hypothetical protein B0H13DRAFT_2468759 [Mycena leptocephala]|nr:hypothetical protein B0H13DRAFT_2468759 [Mycena leptocephala]